MNALMIKDWMLLKRQGRYMILVLGLACVFSFSGSESFSSFLTSYLTFMTTIFSFSSFSYDEYDNGMAYLMALPSGRRNYVKAKYLFSILIIAGAWFLGCLLRMALFLIRFSAAEYLEILPTEPSYLLVCLIYVSAVLPAIFKFGAEKGRNMAFMVLAVLAMTIFVIARFGFWMPAVTSIWTQIDQWCVASPFLILTPLLAACILALGVSCRFSIWIMENREF